MALRRYNGWEAHRHGIPAGWKVVNYDVCTDELFIARLWYWPIAMVLAAWERQARRFPHEHPDAWRYF
jgi:hypothetical protein